MKRLNSRIWLSLFFAVMMISLCLPAYAGVIDPEAPVTLTLNVKYGSDPIGGMEFSIYRVADADNFPNITVTPEFTAYSVSFLDLDTNEEWLALAETLAGYVASDNLTPYDTDVTDSDGVASFPNTTDPLEHGLYLVIGKTITINDYTYKAVPYFVFVPYVDELTNEPVYDVVSNVKISIENLPDTIDRRVIKIWNDVGASGFRPVYVEVVLLRDGEPYETVRLNSENNWRHDWIGLPSDHQWSLIEYVPTGYTVSIRLNGITFVVTNSKPPPPPPPPPPPIIVTTEPEVTTAIVTLPESEETKPEPETKPETEPEPETEITIAPETIYVDIESPQTACPEDLIIEGPQLPQTGMLQWPVPLLGFAGLASTVFGIIKIKNRDDE